MGATADTYQLTIHRLTPDGQGGFWWLAKDDNDRAYQVNWSNSIVESAAQLFHVDTFLQLLNAMDANNIALPLVEVRINVDSVADQHNLQGQFTSITNPQINGIAAVFDPVALCKLFGVLPLVRKFYINGHLSLLELSDILLYMGERGKVTRDKVETITDTLLANNEITEPQYNAFWVQWAQQVGT